MTVHFTARFFVLSSNFKSHSCTSSQHRGVQHPPRPKGVYHILSQFTNPKPLGNSAVEHNLYSNPKVV